VDVIDICYPNGHGRVSGTEMRKLVITAALVMLSVACGAVGQGGSPSPTPSENPMHFDVTATEKDHAVTMQVGQTLEVVLHGGGQINYQEVRSSDPSILQPTVHPAATAARGVTLAAFDARSAGQAEVTAVGSPICASGQPCPMFAILYTLSVTVT
jgi:hypothetical protein